MQNFIPFRGPPGVFKLIPIGDPPFRTSSQCYFDSRPMRSVPLRRPSPLQNERIVEVHPRPPDMSKGKTTDGQEAEEQTNDGQKAERQGGRTPVNARRPRTMGRFVVGRSADRGRNHAVTDIMLSLMGTLVGAFSLPGSWSARRRGGGRGAIGWKAPRTDQAERTPR